MTRLARWTGREVVAALGRLGFVTIRVRGSHHVLRHADGRCSVVPVHAGEVIRPGLMAKILRDCRISPDDLASRA